MFGIAGYIGEVRITKPIVKRILDLMKNRGPDFKNFYKTVVKDKNILLLHSRLSIIDLESRSNQPFLKDDLVFNF
tara:strand:- start:205 stop:429 length:225 start_codon:yes stop_codon:yes gene_type:complete